MDRRLNSVVSIDMILIRLLDLQSIWNRLQPVSYTHLAENCCLKSVTVSMEPSGKYFASLLYEGYSCENQAADRDYSNAKILGIDYAMQGMAVFSEEIEMEEAGFFRKDVYKRQGSFRRKH